MARQRHEMALHGTAVRHGMARYGTEGHRAREAGRHGRAVRPALQGMAQHGHGAGHGFAIGNVSIAQGTRAAT